MKLSPARRLAMLAVFVVLGVLGPWLAPYDPTHVDLAHPLPAGVGRALARHRLERRRHAVAAAVGRALGARDQRRASSRSRRRSASRSARSPAGSRRRRRGRHAHRRHPDGVPRHPAQHRDRRDRARSPGSASMIFALCANGWVGYARVARGQVLALREREYVAAAVALGASNRARHVAPPGAEPDRARARPDDVRVRRRDPRRGVAVVPRPRPAGRLHLGRDARRRARRSCGRRGFAHYALVPGSRSRGSCSARTSSATACAIASIRASEARVMALRVRVCRSPTSSPASCARSRRRA